MDTQSPRVDHRSRRGKFRCPNMLSLLSFAGITLNKCALLQIGTLTGWHLCRESHPLMQVKEHYGNSDPATLSVQSTPADNVREGGERKKKKDTHFKARK